MATSKTGASAALHQQTERRKTRRGLLTVIGIVTMFVPWLFASARIRGLVLQGARGSLKRTNLALAIFGYLMVVYSTFLTRSAGAG